MEGLTNLGRGEERLVREAFNGVRGEEHRHSSRHGGLRGVGDGGARGHSFVSQLSCYQFLSSCKA